MYEGPVLAANANDVVVAPAGDEMAPQPDEYDYVPFPTITSISTSGGPASLASEFGGTVITVTGRGFNPVGLEFVSFGDPSQAATQDLEWLTVTGTQIQLLAPGIFPLTTAPAALPLRVTTTRGQSAPMFAEYAGIPVVDTVIATGGRTAMHTTPDGISGAPDTGGTPISLSGTDFFQATVVEFIDTQSAFSAGTQYNFTVANDQTITTLTVPQNPGVVDVEACSVTACLPNVATDHFILFPPGAPFAQITSPASGPATGGTDVVITGTNLGCAAGVTFGSVPAQVFGNSSSLLDCGQTTKIDVIAPPLPEGTSPLKTVSVTVTTDESVLAGDTPTTTATFTYEPVAPVFTADSPPRVGTVGVRYATYRFRATGDPAPNFSVSTGALPPGLTLNHTTGVLTGRPNRLGVYTFKVTASNGARPGAVSPALTITIRAAPVFTADTPPANATQGTWYSYRFRASGLPAPTFSVAAGALPSGLTLNRTTGILSGRPTKKGTFGFRVSATNGLSPAAVAPTRSITVG
jgi:hypothetical protein